MNKKRTFRILGFIILITAIIFLASGFLLGRCSMKPKLQERYKQGFQASYVMRCSDYMEMKGVTVAGASGEGRAMESEGGNGR